MDANPFLGVLFHWLGGLAAGSFYVPYRGVKKWAWETYWLAGGFFSWIIAPAVMASLLVPDVPAILRAAPVNTVFWAYFFGVMWGIGGLTFGLSMRYLGMSLGYAIALGFCAVFGTLIPPIFRNELAQIASSDAGRVVLLGVLVCIAGITVSGMAGMSKERELSAEQKKAAIREFSFLKGVLVATFAGIMSASMAFGITAGKPIAEIARERLLQQGGSDLWQNLPVLIVVLWGGFTTNVIWCVILNIKNATGGQYLKASTAAEGGGQPERVPLLPNYLLCALAGTTWYLQFFFYSMGQTRMGKYDFSSWTLHMASIIIFSTLWGVALREWKGTSKRTHVLIGAGLAVLVVSTLIVGFGNYLKAAATGH